MRDTIIAIHYQKTTRSPDFVFPLTIDLGRDGEAWTGTCLELGTSTFGDTLEEVKTELQEAITLQLDEMERLGFIGEYLAKNRVPIIHFPEAGASDESSFTLASA